MRVTVVGTSPAWPNPGGVQSGYLFESNGTRVLVDCGPGVLPQLLLQEEWPRLDAIVISHLHLDHWGDLVPWSYGVRWGTGRGAAKVDLWVGQGDGVRLLDLIDHVGAVPVFEEAFALREYDEAAPFSIGALELTTRVVPHYDIRCSALRVADPSSAVAYSADCGPNDALVEIARDADLFLCEATLGEQEPTPRGHLTEKEARAAFERSGAERLVIVHRPAELGLTDGVERARDGLVVEL
jgi:ribonuclease BN (tRNA processing enzyme)